MLNFTPYDECTMVAVAPKKMIHSYIVQKEGDAFFDIKRFVKEQIVKSNIHEYFEEPEDKEPIEVAISERDDKDFDIYVTMMDGNKMEDLIEEVLDELGYDYDIDEEYDNHPMMENLYTTDYFTRDNKYLNNIDKLFNWTLFVAFNTFGEAIDYFQAISQMENLKVMLVKTIDDGYVASIYPPKTKATEQDKKNYEKITKLAWEYNKRCFLSPRQAVMMIYNAIEHDRIIVADQPVQIFQ